MLALIISVVLVDNFLWKIDGWTCSGNLEYDDSVSFAALITVPD